MNRKMTYILLSGWFLTAFGTTLLAQSLPDKAKPKIKMVSEISYKVEDDKIKNRDSLLSLKVDNYSLFDEDERLIESGKYNSEGDLLERIAYERSKNGLLVKGLRKGELDELENVWIYEYDSVDNLVETKTYNAHEELIKTQLNEYDIEGNCVEMLLTNYLNKSTWRYRYEYNDKGQKVEEFKHKPNGDIKSRRTYHYDEKGNEVEQFKFNTDGGYTKIVSEYDEMNNLINQDWYTDNNEKIYQISFVYIYDSYGNWITKKQTKDEVLTKVWERKIEYYNRIRSN